MHNKHTVTRVTSHATGRVHTAQGEWLRQATVERKVFRRI